jgi:methyltransferase
VRRVKSGNKMESSQNDALSSSTSFGRKKRKEEGRLLKRQRIEAAGGTRPRDKSNEAGDEKERKTEKSASYSKASNTSSSGVGAGTASQNSQDKSPLERKKHRTSAGAEQSSPMRSVADSVKGNRSHDRTTNNKNNATRPPWKQQHDSTNGRGRSTAPNNPLHQQQQHRFGRVMEQAPCRNQPRFSTLSIALPGSVISNCQTRELRTHLVGQIARAATIYHVDEIIVFDDKLSTGMRNSHRRSFHNNQRDNDDRHSDKDKEGNKSGEKGKASDDDKSSHQTSREHRGDESKANNGENNDPHLFMARLLQYCECPQYLRRHFFPMHPSLQFAGLLPPIDAPHHVRAEDTCRFREGIVLEDFKQEQHYGKLYASNTKCLVNCGIRGRPVEIDARLQAGIRCTVELDPETAYGGGGSSNSSAARRPQQQQRQQPSNNNANATKQLGSVIPGGRVVSPSTPRERDGTYWGYTTRLARSIQAVFDECPYRNHDDDDDNDNDKGYDLTIGTSERGDHMLDMGFSLEDASAATTTPSALALRKKRNDFKHALIVFGGVAGIEECIDADESMKLSGARSSKLFDIWVNVCPYQGSRTIRTEEAVLITLARLAPLLFPTISVQEEKRRSKKRQQQQQQQQQLLDNTPVEFTDGSVSEESSSDSDES